jgi:transcription elongation factor GreB
MMTKSPISKPGWETLRAELEQLLDVERPRVVDEVAFAAAQGDRSENAEYIYGKRRLREIDQRLRFLTRRMESVIVVDNLPDNRGEIRFGAKVNLLGGQGRALTVEFVGEDEIEPAMGKISLQSPLGKALLGRKEGDVAEVTTPRGPVAWTVESVTYE